MRHSAPTPSGTPLPLPRVRDAQRRRTAGTVELGRDGIKSFNDLVHELHPDAPQIDADAIASVSRWLESQPADQRHALLQSRLDRLADLETMRADPAWPMEPAQERRIELILGYVASDNDLIPDSVPVHGHLDDALLLELAWPVFAEDVDDYRDFCRYRDDLADQSGQAVSQADWLRVRAEEGALWEHMHRVHGQEYVERGAPFGLFRIR